MDEGDFELDYVATRESWDKPVEIVAMPRVAPNQVQEVKLRIGRRLSAEFLVVDQDPLAALHARLLQAEEDGDGEATHTR